MTQPNSRPTTKTRAGLLVVVSVGLILNGCSGMGGQPVPDGLLQLELKRTVKIAPGRAHAKFQRGRQAGGVNRYAPWCELEIRTVSEASQIVKPDSFSVGRVSQAFVKDYISRVPALLGGLSCDDLVFKETTWWVRSDSKSPVLYLRCFAPYTNCRFGPPLSPEQIQDVVGPTLDVRVEDGL